MAKAKLVPLNCPNTAHTNNPETYLVLGYHKHPSKTKGKFYITATLYPNHYHSYDEARVYVMEGCVRLNCQMSIVKVVEVYDGTSST